MTLRQLAQQVDQLTRQVQDLSNRVARYGQDIDGLATMVGRLTQDLDGVADLTIGQNRPRGRRRGGRFWAPSASAPLQHANFEENEPDFGLFLF
jgi:hypothetical protein